MSSKGMSRLDSTATAMFTRGQEGVAFLQGFSALDWPRLKPQVIGKPPETVYLIARNRRLRALQRHARSRRGDTPRGSRTVSIWVTAQL